MLSEKMVWLGFFLVFLGIVVIICSVLYMAIKTGKDEANIEAGGVIFIGPIPIIWGSSKEMTKLMLVIGVIIGALLLLFYVLNYLKISNP